MSSSSFQAAWTCLTRKKTFGFRTVRQQRPYQNRAKRTAAAAATTRTIQNQNQLFLLTTGGAAAISLGAYLYCSAARSDKSTNIVTADGCALQQQRQQQQLQCQCCQTPDYQECDLHFYRNSTHDPKMTRMILHPYPPQPAFSWNVFLQSLVSNHMNQVVPVQCSAGYSVQDDHLVTTYKMEDDHDSNSSSPPLSYSESQLFLQCLEYHQALLPDYIRRWGDRTEADLLLANASKRKDSAVMDWPRNIPTADEIRALELDVKFCRHDLNMHARTTVSDTNHSEQQEAIAKACQNTEFRIASFYLKQTDNEEARIRGFKMLKLLAERGHPDGMCLYGILLNQGQIPGVDANPNHAVVWWRLCVDLHRHIQATYELAVALYTGEGVVENLPLAVQLFRRAAHSGHASAAYLLGEMLLDGAGAPRDRANALEWLVTAAELGHELARSRVIVILKQDYEKLDAGGSRTRSSATANVETEDDDDEAPYVAAAEEDDEDMKKLQEQIDESLKWVSTANEAKVRAVNLERRYTIGGGCRNPEILARRRTKVEESRDGWEGPL